MLRAYEEKKKVILEFKESGCTVSQLLKTLIQEVRVSCPQEQELLSRLWNTDGILLQFLVLSPYPKVRLKEVRYIGLGVQSY